MRVAVHHRVSTTDPRAHLLEVTTTIRADGPEPLPSTLTLFMPVWTPGSYLVREFARHVEGITCEPAHASITKVRKNAWRIDGARGPSVTVRYRLYCNDLSVRTNHFDETHAFLNGAATFLTLEGHERAPATIEIAAPEGWDVVTALPRDAAGRWVAGDLDALVDAPFEIGLHREHRFDALGAPHRIAVWPPDAIEPRELERFAGDARRIVEAEAALFDGALPYDTYTCILHLSSRGRGGLEHAAGAALLASPNAFATREAYLDLLSLFAHELFHAWNVKRIRPAALTPYRYQEESYTRLLWWFEGGTSYYDWRALRRAKLCTVPEYLDHLASEIAYVEATPGRLVHPLEEASFDAWIKLYRPDENSANSSVSYYRKGEVVCALLDLEIRARSDGRASLDAALAHLWRTFGARGVPVPEGAMQGILEEATGVRLGDLFDAWIRGAGELACAATLRGVGLRLERASRPDAAHASLGLRLRGGDGRFVVASVVRGGAAQRGGIDVGDELIAIGGRRVEGTSVDAALQGKRAGQTIDAIVAREGRVQIRAITLDPPRPDKVRLLADAKATPEQRARFVAWLGEPHPSWGA